MSIPAWLASLNIRSDEACTIIKDLGAEEPEELADLDDDDMNTLSKAMKKLEFKRFSAAIAIIKAPKVVTTAPASKTVSEERLAAVRGANYWDVFCSHNQREGGQQTAQIAILMAQCGLMPWFDQWGESCRRL